MSENAPLPPCPGCGERFLRLRPHLPKCPERDSIAPVSRLYDENGGKQ